MKKDVIIFFKDGEKLVVVGVDEKTAGGGVGEKYFGLIDMYRTAWVINGKSIKYIKSQPHEEVMEHAEKHD